MEGNQNSSKACLITWCGSEEEKEINENQYLYKSIDVLQQTKKMFSMMCIMVSVWQHPTAIIMIVFKIDSIEAYDVEDDDDGDNEGDDQKIALLDLNTCKHIHCVFIRIIII